MKLKALKTFRHGSTNFKRGSLLELSDAQAKPLVSRGLAEQNSGKPSEDLSALTVEKLKELASARGVDLGDASKKADIIAAIELAGE